MQPKKCSSLKRHTLVCPSAVFLHSRSCYSLQTWTSQQVVCTLVTARIWSEEDKVWPHYRECTSIRDHYIEVYTLYNRVRGLLVACEVNVDIMARHQVHSKNKLWQSYCYLSCTHSLLVMDSSVKLVLGIHLHSFHTFLITSVCLIYLW